MGPIAKRPLEIPPFIVMDVLERVKAMEREGRKIIYLEIGEPELPTPQCISEAAIKAIHNNIKKGLERIENFRRNI